MSKSVDDHCVCLYPAKFRDTEQIRLLKSQPGITVIDELDSQWEELYKIRHPETIRKGVVEANLERFTSFQYQGKGRDMYGVWVWYPWNKLLIHFLPEKLHTELRTSRNRNLITAGEQRRFYNAHIGIAGLSVGNAVVSNILHTGGAKYLRLADGDRMSGSNTNRIRAGFDTVGLLKTTVVAREIQLVNPYAELQIFDTGLTEKNLKRFLTHPVPLRVVVDEMDNLYLKIRLRLLARAHKIPVVMAADNGDGVVVDIERYDLDPKRPLMHGDVPESELLAIRPNTPRHIAARIISTWVKPENIAERMMTSLLELGKTLYTWPQLGNAASMAGSLMSYVVRQIVLNKLITQGKVVVSPDNIFTPEDRLVRAQSRRNKVCEEFVEKIGL